MTAVEQRADRSAAEVLSWSRAFIDSQLRQAVGSLPSSMYHIAGYHFGWHDDQGRPTPASSGKALRPALALLAAEAVGGTASDAAPAAVAVELVHNFSLLHDDVMDADAMRRHRPTAWHVFGVNQAILAGDALLTLAFDVLASSETCGKGGDKGIRLLGGAVQQLIDGQSADLAFEKRTDVTLGECLRMAQQKTGALLRCSCALGALFGGGDAKHVRQLAGFGESVGLAFQLADDLLGIWGDPAVTGKPVHSDLRSRKKSLPVVAALISRSAAGRELAELYQREQGLSRTELVHAAQLVDSAGTRRWAHVQIDEQLSMALRHLRSAEPDARSFAELAALAEFATRRDF